MSPPTEQVTAGQAVYTMRVLGAYDFVVLGVSNRFIWKCPDAAPRRAIRRAPHRDHLDVGVGTGYFLDPRPFPSASPRIALMDLNAYNKKGIFANRQDDPRRLEARARPAVSRRDGGGRGVRGAVRGPRLRGRAGIWR